MSYDNVFSALDKALGDVNSIPEDYKSEIRASSLPFCQREYVLHRAGNLAPVRESTFFGDCCMEMGTALHAVAQRYMGIAGLLFGNWKCDRCGNVFLDRKGPVPCCDSYATYEEYEFRHASGITAHPDGVCLELPDGTPFRAVWEFKGCYPGKMAKMQTPIWRHSVFQANFYLHLANEQKNLGLEHIVIVYVDRGLPSNRKYFVVQPNKAVYRNTLKAIEGAKEKLRLRVLPERICATQQDGIELRCPYQAVCFNKDSTLQRMIEKTAP